MKNKIKYAVALGAMMVAAPALAQDKTVKIGVLNDMSSLYADIGGPNSVNAAKLAVEDSGLVAKGWKIDVIGADHQNKPDVGVSIARQWFDVDKVDVSFETTKLISMAKAFVGDVTSEVADSMLQFHGGWGYIEEYHVARAWRDQRLFRLGAGTTETLRYYIAKLMGL